MAKIAAVTAIAPEASSPVRASRVNAAPRKMSS